MRPVIIRVILLIILLACSVSAQISPYTSDFSLMPYSARKVALGNISMALDGSAFDIFGNPAPVLANRRKIENCMTYFHREVDIKISGNRWLNSYKDQLGEINNLAFALRFPLGYMVQHDWYISTGVRGYIPNKYDNTGEWYARWPDDPAPRQGEVSNTEVIAAIGIAGNPLRNFKGASFSSLKDGELVPLKILEHLVWGVSADIYYRSLAGVTRIGVYPNVGLTCQFGDFSNSHDAPAIGISYMHITNLRASSEYYNTPPVLHLGARCPFALWNKSLRLALYGGFDMFTKQERENEFGLGGEATWVIAKNLALAATGGYGTSNYGAGIGLNLGGFGLFGAYDLSSTDSLLEGVNDLKNDVTVEFGYLRAYDVRRDSFERRDETYEVFCDMAEVACASMSTKFITLHGEEHICCDSINHVYHVRAILPEALNFEETFESFQVDESVRDHTHHVKFMVDELSDMIDSVKHKDNKNIYYFKLNVVQDDSLFKDDVDNWTYHLSATLRKEMDIEKGAYCTHYLLDVEGRGGVRALPAFQPKLEVEITDTQNRIIRLDSLRYFEEDRPFVPIFFFDYGESKIEDPCERTNYKSKYKPNFYEKLGLDSECSYFCTNKDYYKGIAELLVKRLKQNPDITLLLHGYIAEGEPLYLAARRATAVKEFLLSFSSDTSLYRRIVAKTDTDGIKEKFCVKSSANPWISKREENARVELFTENIKLLPSCELKGAWQRDEQNKNIWTMTEDRVGQLREFIDNNFANSELLESNSHLTILLKFAYDTIYEYRNENKVYHSGDELDIGFSRLNFVRNLIIKQCPECKDRINMDVEVKGEDKPSAINIYLSGGRMLYEPQVIKTTISDNNINSLQDSFHFKFSVSLLEQSTGKPMDISSLSRWFMEIWNNEDTLLYTEEGTFSGPNLQLSWDWRDADSQIVDFADTFEVRFSVFDKCGNLTAKTFIPRLEIQTDYFERRSLNYICVFKFSKNEFLSEVMINRLERLFESITKRYRKLANLDIKTIEYSIEGNTCIMGDPADMKKLSYDRAVALRDKMISPMIQLTTEYSEKFDKSVIDIINDIYKDEEREITLSEWINAIIIKSNGITSPFTIVNHRKQSEDECDEVLVGDNILPEGRVLNRNAIFYINCTGASQ